MERADEHRYPELDVGGRVELAGVSRRPQDASEVLPARLNHVLAKQPEELGILVLLGHHGAAIDPTDRSGNAIGVRAFNELAAKDARLVVTIIPVRDGLVVGVKVRESA